jgi:hypothetical protein
MSYRWLAVSVFCLVVVSGGRAAPVSGPAASPDPALIVRVQPVERLLADAKFLAGRVGGAAAVDKLDAGIAEMVGREGLAGTGLDLRKPIGLYGVAAAELSPANFVSLVPVADEKAFVGFLERLDVKADRLGPGLFTLTGESLPEPVFLRFANGYAYLAMRDRGAIAPERLVAPGRVFVGDDPSLASAILNFDRIPEPVRKRGAFQLTMFNGLAALAGLIGQTKGDNDSGLERDLDVAQLRAAARWGSQLLTYGREASVRVNFDRSSGEVSVAFGGEGRPGTPLAKAITAIPTTKSLFTGLVRPDAAGNVLVCSTLLAEQRETFIKALMFGAEAIGADLDVGDELRAPLGKLMEALTPTVKGGLFDAGASLRSPTKDEFAVVAGLRIKDGKKVEAALRDVFKSLPEGEQKKLKLDVFKSGGVLVHEYQMFAEADPMTKSIFGDGPLFFAVREDAVILAFGPDGRKLLEDALAGAKEQPAPVTTLDFSVKRLSKLVATLDEDTGGMLEKAAGDGIDRVRLFHATIDGGQRFLARVAFNLQFMVGIGLAMDDDDDVVPPVPVQPPPAAPPGQPAPAPAPPLPAPPP